MSLLSFYFIQQDQHFEQLGKQFFDLYNILKASQPIRFALSAQQQEQFNSFFAQVQKEYSNLFGFDIVASVRRLGLITFRIAMILTSLRIIDGSQISNFIGCDDSDFQTAITMARVLLQQTAKVFGSLPSTKRQQTARPQPLSNSHLSTTFRQSSTARPILLLPKS